MGKDKQRIQSGVGIGLGIPFNGEDSEFQVTFFPLESGWSGGKDAKFNRVSPECRISFKVNNSDDRKYFCGFRFGTGKVFWKQRSAWGFDARVGVNKDFRPIIGLEFHFADAIRRAIPGVYIGLERDLGEDETSLTTGLRWAIPW